MKAFLSHTSTDKDLVGLVHEKLSKHHAWYDAVDIENGESIPDKINEGLKFSTHYVLFWSEKASRSPWVKAELNAAFVRMLAGKCKFMIFVMDDTPLPELLNPYRYDKTDKSDLNGSATFIAEKILEQGDIHTSISEIVSRSREVEDIEDAIRDGYKVIILSGILGIGKYSIVEKALTCLYPNRATSKIVIDFNRIPGLAELSLELSRKTKKEFFVDNHGLDNQKTNIRYFFEIISLNNTLLVLKDVKSWLLEDGSANEDFMFVVDLLINTELFSTPTIITSSRFVKIPSLDMQKIKQHRIRGVSDQNAARIIEINLPRTFEGCKDKNLEFAKRLYGYPLGAKLAANYIACFGYDYYLMQPPKIQELKLGLAKELVTYSNISEECMEYLKLVALCKSKLRNGEYAAAIPEMANSIARLADEAFFAGITKFDDDGCYQLEPIVEDYFYSVAFSAHNRKDICKKIGDYLINQLKEYNDKRLIPAAVHILTLSGRINEAKKIRSDLLKTMISSMWDQYNHMEYDEAKNTATELMDIDESNLEARYVMALCLTRSDQCDEATKMLTALLDEDSQNQYRYYHALGRVKKRLGLYPKALELFQSAIMERPRFISPYREMAECYIFLQQYEKAWESIENAKQIDNSNIFITLLEARLLQKEDKVDASLLLLGRQNLLNQAPDQVCFRIGRAHDQKGETQKACEHYKLALEYNPRMYDAALCLLSHAIIETPADVETTIAELRPKLRGKRKIVLTNIEARFIGYVKKNILGALQLLDGVKPTDRDKQWYAVQIQLLDMQATEFKMHGQNLLYKQYNQKLILSRKEFQSIYGNRMPNELDLLPDD